MNSSAYCSEKLSASVVEKNLLENYTYLIDSQVTCDGSYTKGKYICNKNRPGERRILGSWDSYIVPVFMKTGVPVKYVDSNMFVTAHTVFPLYFMRFSDPRLEKQRRDSIYSAMNAINIFKRDNSFAFWPEIGGSLDGQVNRIGPLNLSPLLLSSQIRTVNKIQQMTQLNLLPENVAWMQEHLDLDNKQLGFDALFSVPNDADDTALGIVSNFYFYKYRKDKKGLDQYLDMTSVFNKYTDKFSSRNGRRYKSYLSECKTWYESIENINERKKLFVNEDFLRKCSLDDEREFWRYENEDIYTGSYLTWLYDETVDIYANPEKGVALPGQNSIDCNVVSNVLYSLALTKKNKLPEYKENYQNSCNTLANIIVDENNELRYGESPREIDKGTPVPVWTYCGLFYPAHMTFPYLISKAIVEAKACQDLPIKKQERFDLAMTKLVENLMEEQDNDRDKNTFGKWYEKIDDTSGLSTAFGGVSFANFYEAYGDKLGIDKYEFVQRISRATKHIIEMSEKGITKTGDGTSSLEAGTFFGGGTVNEIAHWRSRAFSTSVSLELMMKYLSIHKINKIEDGLFHIGEKSRAMKTYSERDIISNYKKESLSVVKQYGTHFEGSMGLVHSGEYSDGGLTEAVIGIELSTGEHFVGNMQEAEELIAFYHVKLNSEIGIDLKTGNINTYNLDAKFLGVSTKTAFIVSDEVAYLPISYVKENDFSEVSVHAGFAKLAAPIYTVNDQVRLDISLTGKVLGMIYAQNKSGTIKNSIKSLNLANFEIGLALRSEKYSAEIFYGSGIGYSEDNSGQHFSSHKNHELGLKLNYSHDQKHSFSFEATRNTKHINDELELKLEYRYQFK